MPFGEGDFRGGDRIKRGSMPPGGPKGPLGRLFRVGARLGVVRACNGCAGTAEVRSESARRELKSRCLPYTIDMTDSLRTS